MKGEDLIGLVYCSLHSKQKGVKICKRETSRRKARSSRVGHLIGLTSPQKGEGTANPTMATPPASPPPPLPPPPTDANASPQKDLIWEDIQAEFQIPEASDSRTKKKILQIVGERWRQFKSDLTRKWALAVDKDGADDIVCEKYGISKEKWTQFCQTRRDPSWEDVRKKAQASQKQNTAPHVLSRGGYEYLEEKLMAEKTKKRLEEAAQSGSTEGIIDPPSPIRRHVKWKMARTKKTGQMTSEAAKEIADRIDSLDEQASQGSFVPHGRQDILTVAIGRPEHPGRVRAVGAGVTIKQYFGSASRTSRSSSSMPLEDLEQLTQQIRDQLEESITEKVTRKMMESFSQMQSQFQSQMQSQGIALPPEPEVGPSGPRVSTKESCVAPSGNDPGTGDSDKCGLYIEENPSCLVALGRLYEGSTTVHNIPLLHGQVKVGVEEVKDTEALVPVPTDEVTLVGQALNTFLAWPTHLVKRLSEQAAVSPAKPPESPDEEVDDPLYLMTLTIPQLFLKPLQVMWDATIFGHEDLSEIAHGGQCLSISVIQLWILPDNYLKGIINSALKGLDDTPQPKSKAAARWIVVKCNRQKGITECGYYVMHWMSTIILGSFRNNWETLDHWKQRDSRHFAYSGHKSIFSNSVLGIVFMIVIFLSKDEFAKIFTNSEDMIRAVADLAYLLGVSIMSGVAVGSGWQVMVGNINLACYYVVGLPIGIFLGFNQHLGVKDLAKAFIQVLGNEKTSKEVFNISGEKYVTFD
ncbi:Protein DETOXIFICATION 34 [Glycine soja]